uniref:Odorant receptor n=1 Tax=Sirex noctilio TaxID=36765 RepID=A0A857N9U4_9HYME|nr:odorant receptor 9 [Sirex noctilio]
MLKIYWICPDPAVSDLEFAINWYRFNLRLLGIWPDQDSLKNGNRILQSFKFSIAAFFMLSFISLPQTTSLITMCSGNLDLIIENLAMANIPVTVALIQLMVFWYNSNVLRPLLIFVIEDWTNPKSDRDRQVMLKNAKTAKIISVGCSFLTQTMVISYIVIQIFVILQRDSENVPRELIYQAYFPYNTKKSPNYELTCFGQSLAAVIAALSYSGINGFLAMLVLHLCGQLNNLCFMLKNLVSNIGRDQEIQREFQRSLIVIAKRHNHLNRFAAAIEDSFSMMLLIQILACSVLFCFQGYEVFVVLHDEHGQLSTFQLLFLVLFLISMMLHLFLYCYVGDELYVESSKIVYAAYECKWYKLNTNQTRDLIIIMLRAKIPLEITAGKFCSFSFVTFSQRLDQYVCQSISGIVNETMVRNYAIVTQICKVIRFRYG